MQNRLGRRIVSRFAFNEGLQNFPAGTLPCAGLIKIAIGSALLSFWLLLTHLEQRMHLSNCGELGSGGYDDALEGCETFTDVIREIGRL